MTVDTGSSAYTDVNTLLEEHARRRPSKIYIESPDQSSRVTWGEFEALTRRFANLLATEGIHAGDRISVLADNGIIKGGVNIAPLEIADCLLEHEDVADAATVGVKDGIYGEVPVGFAAPRPGRRVAEAALLAHCRAKLVAFKVPAAVLVVDAIPKNANGKIDRHALAALWDARPAR
jgi:acyl-CoA synthetase (AMP-forming)/AMP-acid ligase II